MDWKKFKELDKEAPDDIVRKKIEGFENATNSMASLALAKLEGTKSLTIDVWGDFKFTLYLFSPILKGYKFTIISFGYDIRLEPISYLLEESIDEELYGYIVHSSFADLSRIRTVETIADFDSILNRIFESAVFENVVGGLIKVAKRDMDK